MNRSEVKRKIWFMMLTKIIHVHPGLVPGWALHNKKQQCPAMRRAFFIPRIGSQNAF